MRGLSALQKRAFLDIVVGPAVSKLHNKQKAPRRIYFYVP